MKDEIMNLDIVDTFFNTVYHHGIEYDDGSIWNKRHNSITKGEQGVLFAINYALRTEYFTKEQMKLLIEKYFTKKELESFISEYYDNKIIKR